jgi:parallel beta-helix repeat protein
LWKSDDNTVSGNIFLGNDECIKEVGCYNNIFENNDCGIIFLISIISGVAIVGIVTILLIKHIRKRIQ